MLLKSYLSSACSNVACELQYKNKIALRTRKNWNQFIVKLNAKKHITDYNSNKLTQPKFIDHFSIVWKLTKYFLRIFGAVDWHPFAIEFKEWSVTDELLDMLLNITIWSRGKCDELRKHKRERKAMKIMFLMRWKFLELRSENLKHMETRKLKLQLKKNCLKCTETRKVWI